MMPEVRFAQATAQKEDRSETARQRENNKRRNQADCALRDLLRGM